MWRLAHVLHPDGKNRGGLIEQDLLRPVDDRLNARAAEAIYGQCRYFLRQAGFESDVTRTVDRVAGRLQRISDDHMVDLFRRDVAAQQRFLRCDHSQIDGADVAEMTVVFGHWGAGAVDDDNLFLHSFLFNPRLSQKMPPASATAIH